MVSRTAGFRRRGMALAMLVGPVFFVLANAAGAWETRDGGDDMTGSAALALAAAHPGLERASMVTGMLGCLLMVPAVLGAMRLVEQRAARLGLVAGLMVSTAYVCYFAMLSGDRFTLTMAARAGTSTTTPTSWTRASMAPPSSGTSCSSRWAASSARSCSGWRCGAATSSRPGPGTRCWPGRC